MATIDLNNLILPKKVNYKTTDVSKETQISAPVYVDLHLDLETAKSIGLGENPSESRDILVDTNLEAIKNSIRNIFQTKKGEKLLSPEFGCSLESFLFESVSDLRAKAIGDIIYNAITTYEPRVNVIKIYVQPNPQSTASLSFRGKQLTSFINKSSIDVNGNSTMEYGPGYAITVIYQIIDIKVQDTLNILAQIGGQILV